VIVGDSQITSPPGRARGALLRAYDKQTGKEVGGVDDAGSAERIANDLHDRRPPVHHRRVSGGVYTGEYVASLSAIGNQQGN